MIFAVVTPLLGKFADNSAERPRDTIHALGAIQFTVLAGVLLASSLIPRGSFAINPKVLRDNNKLDNNSLEPDDEGSADAQHIELKSLAPTTESVAMKDIVEEGEEAAAMRRIANLEITLVAAAT